MPSPTPVLDRLLARLSQRLAGLIWLHGLGTALTCLALWTLFCFFADWYLHVPAAIRWVHLAVWLGAPAWLAQRELIRPLRRRPGNAGLAVLIERARPDLDQLLISAVELDCEGRSPRGREQVRRVRRQADERAAGLSLDGVLDPHGPRLRLAAAAVSLSLVAALFLSSPALASIFANRLFGGSTPWPQLTHLTVEIPLEAERGSMETGPDTLRVRVARGTDVPVRILARGQVPDEVLLIFDNGERLTLGSGGTERFSTVLRSVQEDLSFRVYGGDDQDGEPAVLLNVLNPPDVMDLAVAVEPPPYSGLPVRVIFGGNAEVLAGSRLTVHAFVAPPGTLGSVRILPADHILPLVPSSFPVREGGLGEAETRESLAFEILALTDLRYRFELRAPDGMVDPEPGLFAVDVIEDRSPVVQILLPGRAEVDLVPSGRLPLQVRATDDFALRRLTWSTTSAGSEGETLAHELLLAPLPGEERAWGAGALLVPADLLSAPATGSPDEDGALEQGRVFMLTVTAEDNRQPEPGVGRSAPLRVRLIGVAEFMRRVQDRLAKARLSATGLVRLWNEKLTHLRALAAAVSSDGADEDEDAGQLVAALTGGRRVAGDARSLTRDLASVAEDVLYSGIDERAGPLMEAYHRSRRSVVDRAFHPQPWMDLSAGLEEGRFGAPEFAGQLVELTALALFVSEEAAPAAVAALGEAVAASAPGQRARTLATAIDRHTEGIASLERLREHLAEWDNFQSVLSLTRDILNRQRNLIEHTRQFARDQ